MPQIYNDGTYLKNNPTWNAEDAPIKASNIIKVIDDIKTSITSVAEVGCGSGEILVELERKLSGISVFKGFDISIDAISIAKTKETDKIKFEADDFANKETDKTNFDLLLVMDVIEHVENYFAFLNGIAHKSKYTVFHIPLDMCVWTLFREKKLIDSMNRVGHIHNFTENFIKHILSIYGFTVLNQIYTKPTFERISKKDRILNSVRRITFLINKKLGTKIFGGYSIMLLAKNPV
ncbi:MAG TPA: class I SAM-dependent methyltransferase [Chitinophagaceae bacterium]|jgi:SAM-dependent methyltransferase|nr:class I SAM-dependent methyltransferase [Chitinophagaceae bacterium]HMU59703.1 class I SAM-dependent methyltransferase [Chitinophagaceae bacterium]